MLQVLNCLIQIRIRPAVSFGSESESGILVRVENEEKQNQTKLSHSKS